ncbi:MAG: hypothetical protein AAGI28_01865 [Pseudomonadota bacterium]
MSTDPIPFDEKMKSVLDQYTVPDMSADFADRVVDATENRARPLPQLRPAPSRRWRSGRRVLVGVLAAGALATAAAATGVLEELGIELPAVEEVWSAVTFEERPEPLQPVTEETPADQHEDAPLIEGRIDTPEELEEVFRRVDEAGDIRRENRRDRVDQRIDNAIERRSRQGLPLPSAEQEQRLRDRLERFREWSDERRERRTEDRRDELRETLKEEGTLAREDIIRGEASDRSVAERVRRFRELPPEERRERIRQFREQRRANRGLPIQQEPQVLDPAEETQPSEDPPSN